MEGSEKSGSGKEGAFCEEEEEEIFCCIFSLSKNPLGSMHLIHAVWKKGIIAIFKCVIWFANTRALKPVIIDETMTCFFLR